MTNKAKATQADIAWLRDCLQAAQRQGLHSVQRKFERLIAVCEQTHREFERLNDVYTQAPTKENQDDQ